MAISYQGAQAISLEEGVNIEDLYIYDRNSAFTGWLPWGTLFASLVTQRCHKKVEL